MTESQGSASSGCIIRILTPQGLQKASYQAQSLKESAKFESTDGVYTVSMMYRRTHVLQLEKHFQRLEQSAQKAGISAHINRERLCKALRAIIAETTWQDARFRLSISRQNPEQCTISMESFLPPPEHIYRQGVRCITLSEFSRSSPEVKNTQWIHDRQKAIDTLPPGVVGGILLSPKGEFLEGISTNFYAYCNGELRTARHGILLGTTRKVLLELANKRHTPIREEGIYANELPQVQEAFLSSTSRGVVPVVEINGQAIGSGQPGDFTLSLRAEYLQWLEAHLEKL